MARPPGAIEDDMRARLINATRYWLRLPASRQADIFC